jgi:hypothetical protein
MNCSLSFWDGRHLWSLFVCFNGYMSTLYILNARFDSQTHVSSHASIAFRVHSPISLGLSETLGGVSLVDRNNHSACGV